MSWGGGSTPIGEGQEACLMIAHALCPIVMGLTVWWVKGADTEALFLGGLGWAANGVPPVYTFNWHPLLMVSGVVAETQALLAYRTWPFSKPVNKLVHVLWHMVAVTVFSIGLSAVWRYKTLKVLASLYSLHSWVGISVMAMFFGQFVVGFLMFFFPTASALWRQAYLPLHGFMGTFLYVGLCGTVLLGIVSKTTMQGCGYNAQAPTFTTSNKDTNPADYYDDIYLGCRVSYGIAITTVIICLCTLYAVMDMMSAGVTKRKGASQDVL